jgi:alpha-L-fucosidase
LKDYWVFVSDKPFEKDQNLEELKKRPDIAKSFQTSIPCPNTTVSFPPAHGRYVRVQLQGTGYLSLAEVKVFTSSGKLE